MSTTISNEFKGANFTYEENGVKFAGSYRKSLNDNKITDFNFNGTVSEGEDEDYLNSYSGNIDQNGRLAIYGVPISSVSCIANIAVAVASVYSQVSAD